MLTPQQINQFKSVLEKKTRTRTKQTIQTHENEDRASERESVGELSSYDNHPADMATELYEREKTSGLLNFGINSLRTRNTPYKKEAGTYGICEVSGEEIPFERLEAMPTATTCIQHATNKLNMNTRPVEEEVLSPSFHKHDEDRSVEYDAEDAWQDVANYGTSETPSDLERQDSKNYNGMYVNSEENVGYVEDFENFIGTDMYGKNPQVFATEEHEEYEQMLDDFEERTFKGELSSNESSSKNKKHSENRNAFIAS